MKNEVIKNIPNQILDIDCNDFYFDELSSIHICKKDELENAQLGYRFDPAKNKKIEKWIGDNYYVIGFDDICGDPIIIENDSKDFPVYWMWHDNWTTLEKISSNVENFISILKILNENLSINEKLYNIKNIENEFYDFWKNRIDNTMENKVENKNNIIGYIRLVFLFVILVILLFILVILVSILIS